MSCSPSPAGLCDAVFRALPLIREDELVADRAAGHDLVAGGWPGAAAGRRALVSAVSGGQPELFDAVCTDEDGQVTEIQVKQQGARLELDLGRDSRCRARIFMSFMRFGAGRSAAMSTSARWSTRGSRRAAAHRACARVWSMWMSARCMAIARRFICWSKEQRDATVERDRIAENEGSYEPVTAAGALNMPKRATGERIASRDRSDLGRGFTTCAWAG